MNVMAIARDPKQIFCFGSAYGEADPNVKWNAWGIHFKTPTAEPGEPGWPDV